MAAQESGNLKGVGLDGKAANEAAAPMEGASESAGDAASVDAHSPENTAETLLQKQENLKTILNELNESISEIQRQIGECGKSIEFKRGKETRKHKKQELEKLGVSILKGSDCENFEELSRKVNGLLAQTSTDQANVADVSIEGAIRIVDEDLQKYGSLQTEILALKEELNKFAEDLKVLPKKKNNKLNRKVSQKLGEAKDTLEGVSYNGLIGLVFGMSFVGVATYLGVKAKPWQSISAFKQHWPQITMMSLALLLTVIMILYAHNPKLFSMRTARGSHSSSGENYGHVAMDQEASHTTNRRLSEYVLGNRTQEDSSSSEEEHKPSQKSAYSEWFSGWFADNNAGKNDEGETDSLLEKGGGGRGGPGT